MTSLSTEITNLLQFTICFRKSHRQPQWTLQLVCEVRLFFPELIFTFLRGQQHPKYHRAIRLVYSPFFFKPLSSSKSKKQKSNGVRSWRFKQLSVGTHSEFDTRSYNFFFSQRPTLSPPKILTFPPESSCIYVWNRLPSVDAVKYPVPWNSSSSMTLLRDTYETAGALCTINVLRGVTAMRVRRVYFSGSFKLHDVHLLLWLPASLCCHSAVLMGRK